MKIYDIVQLKDGSAHEVIQVFSEKEILTIPKEGGLPTRRNVEEVETILESLFNDLDSHREKFTALLQAAESRWNSHVQIGGRSSKGGSKKKESIVPNITIDLDF